MNVGITDQEAAATLRAVVNVFEKWQITDEGASVLLDLQVQSYCRWKAGQLGRLDRDMKARLSNLFGIHKRVSDLLCNCALVHAS